MGGAGLLSINEKETSVMLLDCEKLADLWRPWFDSKAGKKFADLTRHMDAPSPSTLTTTVIIQAPRQLLIQIVCAAAVRSGGQEPSASTRSYGSDGGFVAFRSPPAGAGFKPPSSGIG